MVRVSAFLAVAALLATTATAQPPEKLSLKEAVRLATANSPVAQEGDARVAAARAAARGAAALDNPALSLAKPFGQGTGGLDEDVLLTQTLELGGKRVPRIRAAQADRAAALADLSATKLDLALGAVTAYYEALRADSDYRVATDAEADAQKFAKAASDQFQAGDSPRSDVLRSQIELSRAEDARSAAETERDNRYAALNSLLGAPAGAELELTDSLDFEASDFSLPDMEENALRQRPELLSARSLKDSKAASLVESHRQFLPDVFLEARHSNLDPTTGGNSLRVGVTFPLLDFGSVKAGERAAKASLNESAAALREAERSIKLEVETAYRNLEQARKTVVSFRADRLNRAKELADMTQIGYEQGASSYLALLDAQATYRSERQDYAHALADYDIAKAALLRAIGESPL
jgi:cobalt-zinc-cadmium efflux system outer membrane protein